MEAILKELGFMTKNTTSTADEEKILFVDVWGCLKGDDNKGVGKHNLKILLGAIQGLKIDVPNPSNPEESVLFDNYLTPHSVEKGSEEKRIDCNMSNTSDPQTSRRNNDSQYNCSESHDTSKFYSFEIGFYDEHNILRLSQKEIKR